MNLFKKTACAFFTLIILVSSLSVGTVFASDSDMRHGRKVLGQMPNGAALQYAYDRLDESMQSGMPAIVEFSHSTHRVSVNEFSEYVFPLFYSDFPEYFWLENGGYRYKYNSDNTLLSISPAYSPGFSDLAAAKAAFDAKVNALTAGLSGSDYDKAKTLHDRLCAATEYVSASNDQSAYGALVDGKAVCAGYAKAYQHLLLQVGIPAWFVRGSSINPNTKKSENHSWNLVKLDGQWYYTDVTWDDQRENTYYTYFNITTQQLLQSHEFGNLYANLVPNATATEANYFVKEDLILSSYDQNRLAALLKQNNKVQIYIEKDPNAFLKTLDNELLSLGKQLGGTGAFKISYSTNILGNAIILSVNLQTEGHTHAVASTVSAVEASCLTNGQKAHYICSCGAKFLDQACTTQVTGDDQLKIPAKEHTPVWKKDIANHWKVCSQCNNEIADTRSAHTDKNNDHLCDACSCNMPAAQNSGGNDGAQTSTPTAPDNTQTQTPSMPDSTETETPENSTPTPTENTVSNEPNVTDGKDNTSDEPSEGLSDGDDGEKSKPNMAVVYIVIGAAVIAAGGAIIVITRKKEKA